MKIFVHFFGHSFCKCCYQNPVTFCNPFINFIQQIINLVYTGTDFNRRIQANLWAYHLFHNNTSGFFQFIIIRSCRNKNCLV